MILVDANLLLYAYNVADPHHETAAAWLEESLADDDPVRFPIAVLLAYLRLSSDPRVFPAPQTTAAAISTIELWLGHPTVGIAHPTPRHWSILSSLSESGQARGPLVTDAHVAALAIEHGATLCTADRGFARFEGLRFTNPLHQ